MANNFAAAVNDIPVAPQETVNIVEANWDFLTYSDTKTTTR